VLFLVTFALPLVVLIGAFVILILALAIIYGGLSVKIE
jgi:hypothetical protein